MLSSSHLRLQRGDLGDQVGGAAAVAPFVVVPADDLGHVAFNHLREVGGEDRAVGVADDVGRDDRVFGVAEHTLQRTLGSRFDGGVDVFGAGRLAQVHRQVDNRASDHRHAKRDAGELALQFRDDQADCLSGTGAGRDDVLSSGTGTIGIFVRLILGRLIVRVRVNGRHQTLFDAERFVQHLRDGGQAVGRAASVADALEVRVELVVVDAKDAGQVGTVLWREHSRRPA